MMISQKMSSFESVSSDGDLCHSMCDGENYYETNGNYYTQLYPADSQQTGNQLMSSSETGFWGSSPCSSINSPHDSECSPNSLIQHQSQSQSPYHHYTAYTTCQTQSTQSVYDQPNTGFLCDEGYYSATTNGITTGTGHPVVRVIKRRNTANKKERRRTQSINSAYSCLRDRIPNVPSDTKLSKIKTLRLAISYINHLISVLDGEEDPASDFRADLMPSSRKINAERRAHLKNSLQNCSATEVIKTKKNKGRTGWPQHVWASETRTTIK